MTENDEIDLIELFEILWLNKLLLMVLTTVSIICAGIFVIIKEPSYESRIYFQLDNTPPFLQSRAIVLDFQKLFYAAANFNGWTAQHSPVSIKFEDLSHLKMVNGFILSKDQKMRLTVFDNEKNDRYFLAVKDNDHATLSQIYNYIEFTNQRLSAAYLLRAEREMALLEARANNGGLAGAELFSNLLDIDRFVETATAGHLLLAVQHPTAPKKTSLGTSLVIFLAGFTGAGMAVFFIVLRDAIRRRALI